MSDNKRSIDEVKRLIDSHAKRSRYERDYWVHCMESSETIRSVIYDPNGNAMTHGDLCALINELQDENEELQIYRMAIESMAGQYIHPKTSGMELAMAILSPSSK